MKWVTAFVLVFASFWALLGLATDNHTFLLYGIFSAITAIGCQLEDMHRG